MAIPDRKLRDRAAQRRFITATARAMAEKEGWDAVTTRRLASEIEYSQPVIYKHFASMDALVQAVALEGFEELAVALRTARHIDNTPEGRLGEVARAFECFATNSPALYDAMFSRATRLPFAGDDLPAPLIAAFAELREAVAAVAGERDIDTLTEVFWAALHGLTALHRAVRLRPGHQEKRRQLLVAQFGRRSI